MDKMMNFLDIPGEVLTHNLFPLLEPNDIVRLRRVCKPLKSLADHHLRLKVRNNRLLLVSGKGDNHFENEEPDEKYIDLIIDEDEMQECDEFSSMEALLNMKCHLPVARVALNLHKLDWDKIIKEDEDEDGGEEWLMEKFLREWDKMLMLENEEEDSGKWPMKEFLEKYGGQITEVKLTKLSVPMRKEKEIAFFEALPNLTRLTIQVMETDDLQDKKEQKFLFPATFKNLRHLDIKQLILSKENDVAEKKYFWEVVEHCPSLEHLTYPWFRDEDLHQERASLTALCYQYLGNLLQNNRLTSLKYYDMDCVFPSSHSRVGASAFADFCAVCNRCDVKLLNVLSSMFDAFDGGNDRLHMELENIGRSIVSVSHGLWVECFMVPFPNMEKLHVGNYHSWLESEDGQITWRQFGVPVWPKLKRIEYEVNLNQTRFDKRDVSEDLFHILFVARRRPTVTQLKIDIVERRGSWRWEWEPNPQIQIRLPLLKKVAWSCLNLRKVHFRRWTGTNKALSIFWEKLPLLEDVCIEDSPAVGNSSFVGEDLDKPVFLELKHLKRLRLLNVQNMQKITDTAFILVFRHLKIQSFHLTSCTAMMRLPAELFKIKSISKEGIRSLLTSNFAKHVERFPFNTWMLDGMDEAEFHQLRDEFRSAQMH